MHGLNAQCGLYIKLGLIVSWRRYKLSVVFLVLAKWLAPAGIFCNSYIGPLALFGPPDEQVFNLQITPAKVVNAIAFTFCNSKAGATVYLVYLLC